MQKAPTFVENTFNNLISKGQLQQCKKLTDPTLVQISAQIA